MLRRWFKFLATGSRALNQAKVSFPKLTVTQAMEKINNPDLFTAENFPEVINSYFCILRECGNKVPKENYIQIIKSFEKAPPLIESLDVNRFVHVIQFARIIKIRSKLLWDEMEKVCINKHISNLDSKKLTECISSFYFAERKNTELWQKLEERIMEEVHSKGNFFTFPDIRIILRSFVEFHNGSEILFEILVHNALKEINNANAADLNDLCFSFVKLKIKKPEDLNILAYHCVAKLNDFKASSLCWILTSFYKLKVDSQYISSMENHLLENYRMIQLNSIVSLLELYKEAWGNEQERSQRILFLDKLNEKMQEIWDKSKGSYLRKLSYEHLIKIMAGMIENGIQLKSEFWVYTAKNIKANKKPIFYSNFKKEIGIIRESQLYKQLE